eukprot:scaffold476979_cov36-Prasinocladus_malaysianus.AAC.1
MDEGAMVINGRTTTSHSYLPISHGPANNTLPRMCHRGATMRGLYHARKYAVVASVLSAQLRCYVAPTSTRTVPYGAYFQQSSGPTIQHDA